MSNLFTLQSIAIEVNSLCVCDTLFCLFSKEKIMVISGPTQNFSISHSKTQESE
jgi:hypothetical protein